jgi:kynurenine formamidase
VALISLQVTQAAAGALERAMLGKSQVVDLTHAMDERSPSLPAAPPQGPPLAGLEHPRSEEPAGEERPGALSGASVPADLTTHLDLPVTVEKGAPTVAEIPVRDLLVHAVLVDVTAKVAKRDDYRVTVEDLQAWERRNGRIPKLSVVLLRTGWSRRWEDPMRYLNLDAQGVPRVPGFSVAALRFLVGEREIRGVGLDAFSPEVIAGSSGEEARALLHSGKWQLVNLTNLDQLPAKGAKLVIAPLRIETGSAPARVIAILP